MRLALVLACSLTALPGCRPQCGTYATNTGIAMDGVSIDHDDYYEACGTQFGAGGFYDRLDELAWVNFSPLHRSEDIDWNFMLRMDVYFPNDELVENARITDVTGEAHVGDFEGERFAQAAVTSASIDVTGVRTADEECSTLPAREFQLEWDIEWGSADGEFHYTATGKDRVSLALETGSSDGDCP